MQLVAGEGSGTLPKVEDVRRWFPALSSGFVFLENAGGSQVPGVVADAMRDYMLSSYVQVGAPYEVSQRATSVVNGAHDWMETWVNAQGVGRVVLGPSATAMVHIVAGAYAKHLKPGDEVVVAVTNHEANAGPWSRLADYGMVLKTWGVDLETHALRLDELERLLTDRTRIVAFPQVSNLLGEVVDVKAVTQLAHAAGARVFVDGVAYAPHGVIDVADWGVDWYLFSNYKVYGPHMATLFGRTEAFADLVGPNHYFIPRDALPGKWALGALNHEGCAGLLALKEYVKFLAGSAEADRAAVVRACEAMTALERPLVQRLLSYLESKPGVRVIGPGLRRPAVGTVSFVSDKVPSQDVARHLASRGVGIRAGHMYAVRLCEALGLHLEQGVVRISLLHYTSAEEIEQAIAALEEVL